MYGDSPERLILPGQAVPQGLPLIILVTGVVRLSTKTLLTFVCLGY